MKKYFGLCLLVFVGGLKLYSELKSAPAEDEKTSSSHLSIMTYNTENLFDTEDDPLIQDEAYLPLYKKSSSIKKTCNKIRQKNWRDECLNKNWTDLMLDIKMSRLAKVIKSYQDGADFVFLQEIENLEVLKKFNKKYLGYPYYFLIEGPDERGIDVAILSKFKNISPPVLHTKNLGKTRGILEVNFNINNETITLLGLHLPSQGSPTSKRKKALNLLNKIASTKKHLVIAAGDFNIVKKEEYLYQNLDQNWEVAQHIGCQSCKGTHYYHPKREWSFLDSVLVSKNAKWSIAPKSVRVWNTLDLQKNKYGSPKKFYSGEQKTGVSDHFPLVVEIRPSN